MVYRATLLAYLTANESQSKQFIQTATLYDTSGKLRELCYGRVGRLLKTAIPRNKYALAGIVVAHVISLHNVC